MIRLHELREKRGLSMMDTAKSLDMPYTTYVNYEKGTREPNIEALFRLADFFEVTIDELLERCAPNEPLTLDELRQMDGKPVYVVIDDGLEPLKMWALVDYIEEEMCLILTNNLGGRSEYYDEDNLNQDHITAYRRPPEGEA